MADVSVSHQFSSDKDDNAVDKSLELSWRKFSFFSYAFVVFFLGIPVWWLTTTPYRAPLPCFGPEVEQELTDLYSQTSLSKADGDVWDELRPQSDYNVHFIFIHSNVDEERIEFSHKLLKLFGLFTQKYFNAAGLRVVTSSEHLWDFSLSNFLLSRRKFAANASFVIDSTDQQIPAALTSELDRLISSSPISKKSFFKLAVFFQNKRKGIQLTHKRRVSHGLAIASWGGLFIPQDIDENATLNAIISVLCSQFSIKLVSSESDYVDSVAIFIKTIELHKKRLFFENLFQTVRILNSLHKLAAKISDLVISDEVSELASNSTHLFYNAFNKFKEIGQIDVQSAAESRRLAESANINASLLELLNFPSDQKYGIYVPLFFPLLAPMLQPVAFFVFRFLSFKFKK